MDLKQIRIEHGYSQEQVARLLEVSRVSVVNWESGKTQPYGRNAIALAKLYGVPVEKLMEG